MIFAGATRLTRSNAFWPRLGLGLIALSAKLLVSIGPA